MRKEYRIHIELNDALKTALDNIRWKHIDIDGLIGAELEAELHGLIEGLVMAYGTYGEVV